MITQRTLVTKKKKEETAETLAEYTRLDRKPLSITIGIVGLLAVLGTGIFYKSDGRSSTAPT